MGRPPKKKALLIGVLVAEFLNGKRAGRAGAQANEISPRGLREAASGIRLRFRASEPAAEQIWETPGQGQGCASPGVNEESGSKKAPGLSGGRRAVQEAVGRKAVRQHLEGHTLSMLVPALLVLLFCLRGRAGTSKGGEGGQYGEGCLPAPAFTG